MNDRGQITDMFDSIEYIYGFLNRFMSFGFDKIWRRRVVSLLKDLKNPVLLDIATGTGQMAFEMVKLKPVSIHAIDASTRMLAAMVLKVKNKKLDNIIFPQYDFADNLYFKADTFDATTIAFGVRNFNNKYDAFKEVYRVLKPGGKLIILELTMPDKSPVKQLYKFYLSKIVPFWGGLFAWNRKPYKYLAQSIQDFPDNIAINELLSMADLEPIECISMTFGIATIFVAEKKRQ